MLIGISGLAGTGKSTTADILVKNHGFVSVAFSDPLKRICRDVFDFTDDQLWGPSESRNAPDKRYQRGSINAGHMLTDEGLKEFPDGKIPQYLSPRYALQRLGTEWGRDCYNDVWVEYAVRVYETLQRGDHYYDAKTGLRTTTSVSDVMEPKKNVVISDVRFRNEISGLKKAGAKLIRIKRPGHEQPKWDHPSETEQMDIPDEEFNLVINNQDSLEDLAENISFLLENGILNHE
jgi:hypothetical protein